jgi:hypothetical protein
MCPQAKFAKPKGEKTMSWFNQVENLLKRYSSGGAAAQPAPDVHAHFDQVAQAAPPSAIAEGLAAAFRSDRTPAFGQMLSGLFTQSNGEQKVGLLNQLMAAVGSGRSNASFVWCGTNRTSFGRNATGQSRPGAEDLARRRAAACGACGENQSVIH